MAKSNHEKSTKRRNYDKEVQYLAAVGLTRKAVCAALGISVGQIKRKESLRRAYELGTAEPRTRAGKLLLIVLGALEARINSENELPQDITALLEIIKVLDKREAQRANLAEKVRYNRERLRIMAGKDKEENARFIAVCEPMTEEEEREYSRDRFAEYWREEEEREGSEGSEGAGNA